VCGSGSERRESGRDGDQGNVMEAHRGRQRGWIASADNGRHHGRLRVRRPL